MNDIDKLKCCGNCKYYEHNMCIIQGLDKKCYNVCDKRWTFRGA